MFDNYCEYKFDEILLRNFFARIKVLSLKAKLQNYEFSCNPKKEVPLIYKKFLFKQKETHIRIYKRISNYKIIDFV